MRGGLGHVDCEHGNYDFETLHDIFYAQAVGHWSFCARPVGSKEWISRVLVPRHGRHGPIGETGEYANRKPVMQNKYPSKAGIWGNVGTQPNHAAKRLIHGCPKRQRAGYCYRSKPKMAWTMYTKSPPLTALMFIRRPRRFVLSLSFRVI
jgi:hypothetical protein